MRKVQDRRLETRAARERLAPHHAPYWRLLARGRHLGYRKGPQGGMWYVRLRLDEGYRFVSLGRADDKLDADGKAVLSYTQALQAAAAWDPYATPTLTVADACERYIQWFTAHKKSAGHTQGTITTHILPILD